MSEQEKFEISNQYQKEFHLDPLKCDNNFDHHILKPMLKDGEFMLVCVDCGFVKKNLPNQVKKFKKELSPLTLI